VACSQPATNGCVRDTMGKITGFMEYQRLQEASGAPQKRLKNWREFVLHLTDDQAKQQAARCIHRQLPCSRDPGATGKPRAANS
ncbi:hypothetical protein CTI14_47135, partial [Methylobacterium radiotolerans]